MKPIRVLIADDHAILRAGLRLVLSAEADIEVVGEAGNAAEVLEFTQKLAPDVLTLDLVMPGAIGMQTIDRLRAECPQTRILVLTMQEAPASARAALAAGVSGYVVKTAADAELLAAVRAVNQGRTFVSVGQNLLSEQTAQIDSAKDQANPLSTREKEVLERLVDGFTNKEIAEQLFLSVKTVETYRARLMDKLKLNSRAELVRYAVAHGLTHATTCQD
jgi:two-component system, NarL family, response regulator NreC